MMDTTEKALFFGFGIAALLIVFAGILVWKGSKTFHHGVGLKRLPDHKLEIEGTGFKLNAVVSSVGGVMILAGLVFASLGVITAPNYEANLLTGITRVGSADTAVPRSGMIATTVSGDTVTLEDVGQTKALSAAWGATDEGKLKRALGGSVGRDFVASYTKLVKDNPNSVVIVDYGGQSNAMKPGDAVAAAWSKAFKDSGLNENQIVVVPMGSYSDVVPTVSVAKPES